MKMPRNRAAKLLDEIRAQLARAAVEGNLTAANIEEFIHRQYGIEPLKPCRGEAHSNPSIDNCGVCAPRWGFTGEKIVIT